MTGRGNTRKKIIKTALDVFSQVDFHRATMRVIARQAGVGLASIYRHFGGKEDLLFSITEDVTQELVAGLKEHCRKAKYARDRLNAFVWYTFNYFQSDPRIADIFFIVVPLKSLIETAPFRKSEWNKMAIEIFREGQSSGEFRKDIDAITMMDVTYALLQRNFQMWMMRKRPKSFAHTAKEVSIVLYSAFRKECENVHAISAGYPHSGLVNKRNQYVNSFAEVRDGR